MFKLDMDAIRKSAVSGGHMAAPADAAMKFRNASTPGESLAELATLAISHGGNTNELSLLTVRLLIAAMKVCDRYGDGEEAREDMREQCLELTPLLQADLLEHFQGKLPFQVH